ncbi:thiazole biosynthesis protein ThiH [Pseudobacteroides cellulosolvens ATCC 35603 = DSM 2933]|uniref:Thiazole biosynthesis protein ThiH n=2 Tax=Pseudobacteroides cellulosolvens TaxID=35825 RepID=A0A0L6JW73_9FIRM|nr:thiazole biosynthesis protein ThiH [Pseudobacteroides cellulosolvens ATCC 35603 = DSM 2933]
MVNNMSFYDVIKKYEQNAVLERIQSVSKEEVTRVLSKESFSIDDYFVLISPAASGFLEEMARKAQKITLQHFGRAMVLYAPLYLANYCVNNCLYCGFNVHNELDRRKLTMEDLKIEAKAISQMGIRHILILTGESRKHSSVEYIKECVKVISEYFTSISIEVYPLDEEEYRLLVNNGVDGLTIYQEVYDEDVYKIMHPSGPKKDYHYRLDTPERGCRSGMRSVGIGALMGLGDWRTEAFYTALHAHYLTSKYPEVEISLSIPRMRPHTGSFEVPSPVDDRDFVQIMLAARLFLRHVGITVSTRERSCFRDNLVGLGVTRMSAGSVTEVGGYNEKHGDGQFEISDDRSVEEIRQMLYSKGFQPVFKDWQYI